MWEPICRCDDPRYMACAVHPGAKVTDPMSPDWPDKQPHEPATCEAFNVTRQGMCNAPLTPLGDCPDVRDHGDEFVSRNREA